jgi:hypothetical protein
MSIWSFRQAVFSSNLAPPTKLVLLALDVHVNGMGEPCFPSYERLARLTSLSRRSVLSHVALAEELGWIKKKVRPNKHWRHDTNLFYLQVPETDVKSRVGESPAPRVGESPAPRRVNDIHPELTTKESTNKEITTAIPGLAAYGSGGGREIHFEDLPADQRERFRSIVQELPQNLQADVIDEILGQIRAGAVKRPERLLRTLVAAAHAGTLTLDYARLERDRRAALAIVDKAKGKELPLDTDAKEKGADFLSKFAPSMLSRLDSSTTQQ